MANPINGIRPVGPPPPPSGGDGSSRTRRSDRVPSESQDQVSVSQRAQVAQEATARVQQLPEVRQDRVAELRAQVERGDYDVDSRGVADALVKETLKDLVAPDLTKNISGR